MITFSRINPDSIQAKGRLFGRLTFKGSVDLARVDRQLTTHFDLTFTSGHAFENDVIGIGIDVQSIANAHRLNQKAQLGRQFFPHAFDSTHQLPTRFGIDQGDQSITNFQANQIDLIDIIPIQLFRFIQSGLCCGCHGR